MCGLLGQRIRFGEEENNVEQGVVIALYIRSVRGIKRINSHIKMHKNVKNVKTHNNLECL